MRDQSRNSVRDAGQSSPTEVAGKQVEALDTFAIDWFALRYENPFSRLQFTLLVRPKEFANQAAQGFEFFLHAKRLGQGCSLVTQLVEERFS